MSLRRLKHDSTVPYLVYDPNQASTIPAQYKPQDHTPATAVVAVKKTGGICVKTYFERGFGETGTRR
jgi:hypothetical protein